MAGLSLAENLGMAYLADVLEKVQLVVIRPHDVYKMSRRQEYVVHCPPPHDERFARALDDLFSPQSVQRFPGRVKDGVPYVIISLLDVLLDREAHSVRSGKK